jgi:hypothetical protein
MDGVERTVARVNATAEIFTPSALVLEILRYIDLEMLAPGKTVLDPACGDGQFLVAAKWVKVFHFGMSESDALSDLYGVDLMRDNVDLCKRRLGGGTVIMGNSLFPGAEVNGQTSEEHELMIQLFSEHGVEHSRKKRVAKVKQFSDLETLF